MWSSIRPDVVISYTPKIIYKICVADDAKESEDDSRVITSSDSLSDVSLTDVIAQQSSSKRLSGIECHLELKELWDKFHNLGTEMIITKSGRYARIYALLIC